VFSSLSSATISLPAVSQHALAKTGIIYFSISSEGFGHSSRAIALAKQLSENSVLIGSYGIALERVKAHNLPCIEVARELQLVGKEGGFDMGQTILKNQGIALTFSQTVQEEQEIMRKNNVTLVVADGRMAAVVAASSLDIPCLVLTNQSAFYPFFEQDSPLVKLLGGTFDWLMKFWLCSAEEILIPDFPPPYTICLKNLTQNPTVKKRTRFVGPLVSFEPSEIALPSTVGERPKIVATLGGHTYRKPLFEAIIKAAEAFPECDFEVITTFQTATLPRNVAIHQQLPNCIDLFASASFVITQAGHSTAMELLSLGKPFIVVPDMKQAEQENNAQRLGELGVALPITYPQLGAGKLVEAISQMLHNQAQYQSVADDFRHQAIALRGAFNTAQFLQHYANRLTSY
jgi:UDP-N-acetylglucosamine--N-acetylmuramyl-(pentapeptide) pyrophosphoryl-undecaprenol N-acetylglucosamine transferase